MSVAGEGQMKTRLMAFLQLCMGGQFLNVKQNEFGGGSRQEDWCLLEESLKLPSTDRGVRSEKFIHFS